MSDGKKKLVIPVIRARKTRPPADIPTSEAEVIAKSAEAKARKVPGRPGRPRTRPECGKATFLLPLTLIEKIDAAAKEKTGGNKSLVVELILQGKASLCDL